MNLPTYLDLHNFRWAGLGKDKAVFRSLGEGPPAYTVAKRWRRKKRNKKMKKKR